MIEPALNELSFYPLCQTEEEVNARVEAFVGLIKSLRVYEIKKIRYDFPINEIALMANYTLADYCNKNYLTKRDSVNLLYASIRRPYLDEDKEELFYQNTDYKFVTKDGQKLECLGLYVAHVTDSFAVGFDTGIFKDIRQKVCNLLIFHKEKNNKEVEKSVKVCCLTRPEDVELSEFVDLISSQEDLNVPKDFNHASKTICEFKHHGSKECYTHSKMLVNCEYVKGVLNSIDFDPSEKKYIHKVSGTNLIEIRLLNTSKGYGLCISTTAQNNIQNHWIAKYLDKKYGK